MHVPTSGMFTVCFFFKFVWKLLASWKLVSLSSHIVALRSEIMSIRQTDLDKIFDTR